MTYTNPQYLVETEWLAKHLYDPELRIIEVTSVLTANRSNVAKPVVTTNNIYLAPCTWTWRENMADSMRPTRNFL